MNVAQTERFSVFVAPFEPAQEMKLGLLAYSLSPGRMVSTACAAQVTCAGSSTAEASAVEVRPTRPPRTRHSANFTHCREFIMDPFSTPLEWT